MEAVVARCGTDVKVLGWLHDVLEDGWLSIGEVEDKVRLEATESLRPPGRAGRLSFLFHRRGEGLLADAATTLASALLRKLRTAPPVW
jgi:hypothetical protein